MGNKRVFITGATGYLGCHLVRALSLEDYELYLYVRSPQKKNLFEDIEDLHFVDQDSLPQISSPDVFIHLATAYGRKGEGREEIFRTNVDFPLEVLKSLDHPKLTFINTDTSLPRELNDYASSKKTFLDRLKETFKGERIINIELEQFFGPKDGSFLGFVRKELEADRKIELTDGLQKRDFIFLDDVIKAYSLLLEKVDELPKGFNNFSLGLGVSYSIREIVELLCDLMNKDKSLLLWGAKPKREGEPTDLVADLKKLKSLGFTPQYSLKEGLERLVNEV